MPLARVESSVVVGTAEVSEGQLSVRRTASVSLASLWKKKYDK